MGDDPHLSKLFNIKILEHVHQLLPCEARVLSNQRLKHGTQASDRHVLGSIVTRICKLGKELARVGFGILELFDAVGVRKRFGDILPVQALLVCDRLELHSHSSDHHQLAGPTTSVCEIEQERRPRVGNGRAQLIELIELRQGLEHVCPVEALLVHHRLQLWAKLGQ